MSPLAELIDPPSILDMSQSDLESLISTIRERRNRVITSRSLAHNRSRNTKSPDLGAKLTKLATRLDKIINKLDADLARAEKLVREVTAMRLELGDATPSELAEELRAAGTQNVSHSGDTEGDDDDDVPQSQERPHSGINPVEASISENPGWDQEDNDDE
jgi:seryl-tRNA synthetase